MPVNPVKTYFLNLLQKRDYSENELNDKAKLKGYKVDEISTAIKELKGLNFVNDTRLAENLVALYGGKKGKLWIKQKLTQRKLAMGSLDEALNEAVQELEPDITLKKKLERKYNVTDWNNLDINVKQKIARYLQGQGFGNPFNILKQWSQVK